eukprot:TRINITY_DN682_c0_g1_i1.p1 TRINITY_DN682_c0_g1~~TRINITY_DN682_c0_g1_i1.p1  ORF type:complete len:106 (+),score=28.12 TRINITY_DN682_c0_g1_i1:79-396(+)
MGGTAGKLQDVMKDSNNEKQIKALFRTYDKDEDGYLAEPEFKTFANDAMKVVSNMYNVSERKLDNCGGGSWEERLWKIVDSDDDGRVTYDEFRAYVVNAKQPPMY